MQTTILTLSKRVERDRRRVEASATRKLLPIAAKAQRHAAHAIRVGASPSQAATDVVLGNAALGLPGMVPVLTRAMVMADLYGRRRTVLDDGRDGLELAQSDDQAERDRKRDRDLAALLLLLGIGGNELAALYATHRIAAVSAATRIASAASEAAGTAMIGPIRSASVVRHPRLGSTTFRRTLTDSPLNRVKRLSEAFDTAGLSVNSSYGIEREVAKAVVQNYERGRFTGTPDVVESLWGYHYSAVLDSRTTEICRALDGTTAPKNDSFWLTFAPPNHWNCRSCVLPVWKSSDLRPPATIQPYATTADIGRFLEIKRAFLSYR